jgi:hypothetical protein
MNAVCSFIYMCASLTPVVFRLLFILSRFPENVNIPAPKTADLQLGPTTEMTILSKPVPTIFIKFQLFLEPISLSKTVWLVPSEK